MEKKEIPELEILLSTYNGELYLKELFDAILSQTFTNWRMVIRDDGSSDSTMAIIVYYQKKYPDRFIILDGRNTNLGPAQSFGKLIEFSTAPFLALCDQDDVWMPDKLEKQMVIMQEKGQDSGLFTPILVHSDLMVCDDKMNCISDSFWKYQYINPDRMKDIRCLLVQNFVTGCTILMNRALIDKIIPIPEEVIMYDWWIALMAQQLGEIVTIHVPLVKYRQHGDNAIGAKKWGIQFAFSRFFGKIGSWKQSLAETRFQAQALIDRLRGEKNCDVDIIFQYINMFEKKWFSRKIFYLNIGMKKYGMLRQFITWLFI